METSSIDAAIVKLYDVTHVTAFGTDESLLARAVGGDLRSGLSDGLWPEAVALETVLWNTGSNQKQFWELFEQFRSAVSVACDRAGDGEVIVNLTHGYRTQPLIAQAATLFELEDRRRRRLPTVTVRMLYGALKVLPSPDSTVPTEAEIWDMTPIIEAGAWGTAIASLRDHARADRFESLLQDLKRRLSLVRVGSDHVPDFKGLGQAARQLVDALVTNRTHLLKTAPARYLEKWRQLRAPLLARLPPLQRPLDDFAAQVAQLATSSIGSDAGVRASLEACQWLLESEQFSALTALLRETLVTIELLRTGGTRTEPGGDCSGRKEVEHRLGALADSRAPEGALWGELTALRNDVQHAAYNAAPRDGAGVRQAAASLLSRVRQDAARAGFLAAPE